MFYDEEPISKKWNEDLYEYKKSKKESNVVNYSRPLKIELQQSPYNYNKVLLLSFFFGAFGVHRFYVGRRNSAICMIILGFLSCGILSVIWNTVDLIKIFSEKFEDANHLTIKSEKGNPLKGIFVLIFFVLFILFVFFTVYLIGVISEVRSSSTYKTPVTSENLMIEDNEVEMVPYEFNQPIELLDYNGKNTGTIIVKSARMVMGEEAMIEVTYEITKKMKDFNEGTALYTFNGSFLSSKFYDSKSIFRESYLSTEVTNLLGIKNTVVNWSQELEGTTRAVTKYYEFRPLKENFIIGVLYYDKNKKQIATIDLNPLIENKTLDLSVVDQQPVTEQANIVVPLGEEKRVSMLDVRVNRSKIGKGKDILIDNNHLDKDMIYIILDVDIKNSSAVTLTEEDVLDDFRLLDDKFYGDRKYFIWDDKLKVADETLIIKPGESKKIAFVFKTYEKSLKKEKNYYFTYNPHYKEEEKLTKFSIME